MVLLFLSSSSLASPNIKTPGPDFGFIPNSIGIVDPGRAYIETSLEFDHSGSDHSGRFPVLMRFGTAKDWEFRAETWVVQQNKYNDHTSTGSGPLQLGFKRRFSAGDKNFFSPAWGIEAEFLLPVGSDEFHDDEVEPSLTLNFDHWISDVGTMTWNLGVYTPVDEEEGQFLQGFLAAAYGQFVTPDISLYVTGSINYPTNKGGEHSSSVAGIGGYWYSSHRFALFMGYNAGLTEKSSDGAGVIGVSYAL